MKISNVKSGDVLIADGGFTCIESGTELLVDEDFSVPCSEGKHFLDGQIDFDDGETLIGFHAKTMDQADV
jgi:hypothetical protein